MFQNVTNLISSIPFTTTDNHNPIIEHQGPTDQNRKLEIYENIECTVITLIGLMAICALFILFAHAVMEAFD